MTRGRDAKHNQRLLVLGFDGMDAELVRAWAAQSRLPNFRELLRTSAWCEFDIPAEYCSGAVWPTICTGLPVAQNRSYFGTRLVEGSYRLRPRCPTDIQGRPFWESFADHGSRAILADVPFASVGHRLGATHLQGWGLHDRIGPPGSQPSNLLRQVRRKFGSYPLTPAIVDGNVDPNTPGLEETFADAIEKRCRILDWLGREQSWDLFFGVFAESHSAGHLFWPRDKGGIPAMDYFTSELSVDTLRNTYEVLDRALGKLRNTLGGDATIAVVLSHGMGPNLSADHMFPQLLNSFNSAWTGKPEVPDEPNRFDDIWKRTVNTLPARLRSSVRDRLPMPVRKWLSLKRQQQERLWSEAVSFALPGLDGFSALRVNLKGREPNGQVAAGDEYRQYMASLVDEIQTWTDGASGKASVSKIYRADDHCNPLDIGPAPDIMIWWSKDCMHESLASTNLGIVSKPPDFRRSGEHIMRSLFAVHHADAATGMKSIAQMSLLDIAPTILELARLDVNENLPGRSRVNDFFGER